MSLWYNSNKEISCKELQVQFISTQHPSPHSTLQWPLKMQITLHVETQHAQTHDTATW